MDSPFLTHGEKTYSVGDWLMDKRVLEEKVPTIIADVFTDDTGDHVILRDPVFKYEVLKVSEFVSLIEDGTISKIEKPLYLIGQRFKNKFTEEYLLVLSISPAKSYETGEYNYFVTEYKPQFGDDYKSVKESQITNFYMTEGVESNL